MIDNPPIINQKSRNHLCVGVLFASLINSHFMHEEQYEGGKSFMRES